MNRLVLFLIVFSFSIGLNAQVKTPEEMASTLISIGDSVHKATLTPIEKYNRYKPFDRSYLGISVPFGANDNGVGGFYRVELYHKVGFYFSIPYGIDDGMIANTTLEEIKFAEEIALLQSENFTASTSIDSSFSHSAIDLGVVFAPWTNHTIFKNIYISLGVVNNRSFQKVSATNNGLLELSENLIYTNNQSYRVSPDLGIKYVMPYAQVGLGYRLDDMYPGFYYNAGLNIPINLFLTKDSMSEEKKRQAKRFKNVDSNAKAYQGSNF